MDAARCTFLLALLAAGVLVAAGYGAQFGLWGLPRRLPAPSAGAYTRAFAVAALALVVLVIPKWRSG
jgi:hypothetical protein